ncbi:MAG: hypothetical protein AAF992_27170 [Bacteroidota bacterium]
MNLLYKFIIFDFMALFNELTDIITELDCTQRYPYQLPGELLHRFNRFREAMQLVATTMNNQRGRAFLRKYENGSRGQQLVQVRADSPIDRETLMLMTEFCQDANQLEDHLKQSWKRNNKPSDR